MPADISSVIGGFDRDVEIDDVAARHIEEKPGRRVGRAGHEGGDMLGLRKLGRDVGARGVRQEHQRPHAGRRKLHQADAAEARAALGEQRLEDLLQALVDRPHDRHAVENVLARLDQLATDEVCGQEPEQRQRNQYDDQTDAGDLDRQIGLGPVGNRNERPHQIVDPVDEPPGETDGDVGRPDQDQPGQEIVPQPADESTVECDRLFRIGRGIGGRHDSRISVKLVHATTIISISARPNEITRRRARRRYTPKSRPDHSTVTDLARLRGWSTSVPITTAV